MPVPTNSRLRTALPPIESGSGSGSEGDPPPTSVTISSTSPGVISVSACFARATRSRFELDRDVLGLQFQQPQKPGHVQRVRHLAPPAVERDLHDRSHRLTVPGPPFRAPGARSAAAHDFTPGRPPLIAPRHAPKRPHTPGTTPLHRIAGEEKGSSTPDSSSTRATSTTTPRSTCSACRRPSGRTPRPAVLAAIQKQRPMSDSCGAGVPRPGGAFRLIASLEDGLGSPLFASQAILGTKRRLVRYA